MSKGRDTQKINRKLLGDRWGRGRRRNRGIRVPGSILNKLVSLGDWKSHVWIKCLQLSGSIAHRGKILCKHLALKGHPGGPCGQSTVCWDEWERGKSWDKGVADHAQPCTSSHCTDMATHRRVCLDLPFSSYKQFPTVAIFSPSLDRGLFQLTCLLVIFLKKLTI